MSIMNYEYVHNQNLRVSRNHRTGAETYSYTPIEGMSHYRSVQMPVSTPYPCYEGDISSNRYSAYDYNSARYPEHSTKVYPENAHYQMCCNDEIAYSNKAIKRKYNNGPGAEERLVEPNSDSCNVVVHGRDSSYPEALNKLIHALQCELCNVKSNSLISARDHYESKVHDRSITAWLRKNYTEKGLEAPVVKRFVKHGNSAGPEAYYCEACNVKLTSLIHANQHYGGRKHRLAMSKLAASDCTPMTISEVKYQQPDNAPKSNQINYVGFYGAKAEDYQITNDINQKTIAIGTMNHNSMLYCSTCNINVTSAVQMTMHLAGIKHKKKLLKCEDEVTVKREPCQEKEENPINQAPDVQAITNSNPNLKLIPTIPTSNPINNINSDMTMYRTPSGQYYCKVCNTTMTNVTSLHQHLLGKRHHKAQAEETAKACINNTRFIK